MESITNKNFEFEDFNRDDYEDTRFVNCNFNGCSFDEAVFTNCHFVDCTMKFVSARQAMFSQVLFDNCQGAIILRETYWEGAVNSRSGDLHFFIDETPPGFVNLP